MPTRTAQIVLLTAAMALLSSCAQRAQRAPMVRTTTYHTSNLQGQRFGAAAGAGNFATTVTESPYESPAYSAAGTALFSRP